MRWSPGTKVFLNGIDVENVIEADDEEGWVKRYVFNAMKVDHGVVTFQHPWQKQKPTIEDAKAAKAKLEGDILNLLRTFSSDTGLMPYSVGVRTGMKQALGVLPRHTVDGVDIEIRL